MGNLGGWDASLLRAQRGAAMSPRWKVPSADRTRGRREEYERNQIEKARRERQIKCPACNEVIGVMDRNHEMPLSAENHVCPKGKPYVPPSIELDVPVDLDALSKKLRKFDGRGVSEPVQNAVRNVIASHLAEAFQRVGRRTQVDDEVRDKFCVFLFQVWMDAAGDNNGSSA